jgi:hypothetical protein
MVNGITIYIWTNRRGKAAYYPASEELTIGQLNEYYSVHKFELFENLLLVYMLPRDGSSQNLEKIPV